MKLFLDSSVLIAASGSENGASRYIITKAAENGWGLLTLDRKDFQALLGDQVYRLRLRTPGDFLCEHRP